MRVTCADCGVEFEAKRASRQFCSGRCTKRSQRRPKPPQPLEEPQQSSAAPVHPMPAPSESARGPLEAATIAELEAADRVESAAGQAALALARRVDLGSVETGSSLASLVREHRATLAEAVRDAQTEADPLDELRNRRERKLAGG